MTTTTPVSTSLPHRRGLTDSLLRVDLIILDELGFAPLDDTGTQLLFRLVAGASLLQGYTGFIYQGGFYTKRIHDGMAQRLRAGGFNNLQEAIGPDCQSAR